MENKGLLKIYNETCDRLTDENFTEWKFKDPENLEAGQFCTAVVLYEKRNKWYLEEHNYDRLDESQSTWYARKLKGAYPPKIDQHIMKFFELEKDENLITANSKIRPVILLRKALSDWLNPPNAADHVTSWLCLPLFRYKDRHNQDYVLRDQRLKNPNAFYIPPSYDSCPGILEESATRFQAIQMINENYLKPLKCECRVKEPHMQRPFKLSKTGLELLLYHFYTSLSIFEELKNPEACYQLFKELINESINASIK